MLISKKTDEEIRSYAIPYSRLQDFVKGNLPFPIEKVYCPKEFLQSYGKFDCFTGDYGDIDSDCKKVCYADCPVHTDNKCWNQFYQGKQNIEEKQKILRKYLD